jgi:redox-sensitive bicupin YhaK (pirin superfamily)
MTAGKGIAHAEETPTVNSGRLSGVQLWVALPDAYRHTDPSFTSVEQVPILERSGGIIQLFAGDFQGVTSPAPHFLDILGMDMQVHPHQTIQIPLNPQFEHAVLLLNGDLTIENQPIENKLLYYLGTCREDLTIASKTGGRLLMIGGTPFPEKILMWWNFVARTPEEIRQARDDWEAQRRFGDVSGTQLGRLSAPDLSRFAQANPIS